MLDRIDDGFIATTVDVDSMDYRRGREALGDFLERLYL